MVMLKHIQNQEIWRAFDLFSSYYKNIKLHVFHLFSFCVWASGKIINKRETSDFFDHYKEVKLEEWKSVSDSGLDKSELSTKADRDFSGKVSIFKNCVF